ncbi:uncharacterized protein [Phaseolus vulgaris]|uniref:uncharacterized protein n=1 Tax=Phaseolus vulgaris TaxID=3885 RepID=UPI0035C9A2FB
MTLTHFLNDVNSTKETWNVVVRVLRLWCVQDFTKQKIPFSLEMVLQDEEGVRIHASVRRTLIYKFHNQICEDRVYSIQSFTVASNLGSYRTTKHEYKINFQYDEDIIGVLTGVGTERELRKEGRTSKLNVISIDCDGYVSSFRIQCTLFGNYVDQLNAFLAAGEVENVVIAIQFAKVKLFRDNIYIQNCIDCTKVEYNVLTEEALLLKKSCVLLLLFCTFAYFDIRWLKIVRGCRNFCHRKVVDCEKCNKDIGNNNSFELYDQDGKKLYRGSATGKL